MQYPVATYRIQFHKDFNFERFEQAIDYLSLLGISTVYASPIFEAVPGSTHGYDGVNPLRINPEIGTEQQLRAISGKLKDAGINWLQDIVPNHMAFHPNNIWLMDVLEKGRESKYAGFFDCTSINKDDTEKLIVPFLGSSLEDAVHKGELKLVVQRGKFIFQYYDSYYPINDLSKKEILSLTEDERSAVEQVNQNPEFMLKLAHMQHYRLCHWQETDHTINFRRFFTINGLICLNIQDKNVFEAYHQYIKQLVNEGIISGLRIDHIDGLYEPTEYLENLKQLVCFDKYVVVEKILQANEELPMHWACEGNTGYDFLGIVNNLFTNKKSKENFTAFYQQLTGSSTPIEEQIREKKAHMLHEHMGGELQNLYQLFVDSKLADTTLVTKAELKEAIAEMLIECPVYRHYGSSFPLSKEESTAVQNILQSIIQKNKRLERAVDLLENGMLIAPQTADESYRRRAAHFYKRCMQFTGPLTAKGVEDTLMYTYNRFIGHNDVGDAPEIFGFTTEGVHRKMMARQEKWPLSLNTTSTHDTKRGEDVRARLNVLTDIGVDWLRLVKQWQKLNAPLKKNNMPDANDEYFIYQTLVGIVPMNGAIDENFPVRLEAYLQKALREAKIHSNWTTPNEEYESATQNFARKLLDREAAFWKSFLQFHQRIVDAGIINSLSQLMLKFTCPGIPDIYQGTELWDLTLVDPDNRKAIDYPKPQSILQEVQDRNNINLSSLWNKRFDGDIKLWLTHILLQERTVHTQLFTEGHYIPLKVEGRYAEHVFAFARRYKDIWYVIAAPLHIIQLAEKQRKIVTEIDWRNTRVVLRQEMPDEYQAVFTNKKGKAKQEIFLKDIFKELPFALLKMQLPQNERGSGILLSISSLPSAFGVGDLGHGARQFAKFLSRSRQKYWQILPLNPTESGSGHSPYSSYSAMAGNPLLISPELLADDGLLDREMLRDCEIEHNGIADYAKAEEVKNQLFSIAYENFNRQASKVLQNDFDTFCKQEAYWLDDMSLYKALRDFHQNKPWYEWERPFKLRERGALERFSKKYGNAIQKEKWLQFIFLRQWNALRKYVNSLNIQFFGDMPFYVSYDSVDVWAHREIFCLDEEGNMTGIAGVPPDYFSETGQLWRMPTFNWNVLKKQNYRWWKQRLRKNLELFDLLRIDHFRAFQDYWQVPAGETTAIQGEWIPGPRDEFFEVMQKEFGKLPLVAEDLGDNMDAVYELRNRLQLPGMRVLQFAWGENMPRSVDILHNYSANTVVYTGTHDNNTTVGWYREETNKSDHRRMHHYLGLKVKPKNIHEMLARVAYSSVGKIVILPMQDVLGLDATARMNTPGQAHGNWLWRMKREQVNAKIETTLRDWVQTFNR